MLVGRRRVAAHSAAAFVLAISGMIAPVDELRPVPVASADEEVAAILDGRLQIDPTTASRYFCHDFTYPVIRCFSRAVELEVDAVRMRAAVFDGGWISGAAAFGPSDYVTIYDGPTYSGSYMHLSQNYDGLWVIGWNDRISSYKARNSRSGIFYENWYYGGIIDRFCCNETVAWLTSTYDDQFSSVKRT